MSRRRAFTSEWIPRFAVCVFNITIWSPLLARLTRWPEAICLGVLTLLAVALTMLSALIAERDAHKAWVWSNWFLALPFLVWLTLIGWFLLLALWHRLT